MPTVTEPSIIHRLRLRLHCDQTQGRALQQQASRLFHRQLQPQLQALVARLAVQLGTRTLALDKLVLDLGVMELDDFDEQFAHRMLAQLERRLTDLIASLPPAGTGPTATLSLPRRQAHGHAASAGDIAGREDVAPARGASIVADGWPAMQAHDTPVEALVAYIRDGHWPLPALWRAGPGAWLRRQIDAGAGDWTPVLALCCSSPERLRRLHVTFDLAAQSALQHAARHGWVPVEAQAAERWQRWCAAVQAGHGVEEIELELPVRDAPVDSDVLADLPPASVRAGVPPDSPSASVNARLPSDVPPASVSASVPTDSPSVSVNAGSPSDSLPTSARASRSSSVPPIPLVPGVLGSAFDPLTPIAVSNAGLVLLWPMLARLFNQLQLLQASDFIDVAARARAVCLLDWLLWDDAGLDGVSTVVDPTLEPEWRTPMSKLLCGWPLAQPLPGWQRPDSGQRQLLRTWLFSSVALWPAMQRVGTAWARELFLRRDGQALCSPERIELVVMRDASDVLLHDLPWSLHEIHLPWMPAPLLVDWIEPGNVWPDVLSGGHPA